MAFPAMRPCPLQAVWSVASIERQSEQESFYHRPELREVLPTSSDTSEVSLEPCSCGQLHKLAQAGLEVVQTSVLG